MSQSNEENVLWLSRRETHGYVDGWKHLDKWSDVGKAQFVASAETEDNGEDGAGWALYKVTELEDDCTLEDAIAAIEDHHRFGCRCRHDCCAHKFGGARDGQVAGELDGAPLVRVTTWWALNI